MESWRRSIPVAWVVFFVVFCCDLEIFAVEDWLPIDPADLRAISLSRAPGADAAILYREEIHDDRARTESHYVRIKILTEKGRQQWSSVEIPYLKSDIKIKTVEARTVQMEGTVVSLEGEGLDTTVLERKTGLWHRRRVLVRRIAFPQVEVGSIVEYKYTLQWGSQLYLPTWDVQQDLYQRELILKYNPIDFGTYRVVGSHGKPLDHVSLVSVLPPDIPRPVQEGSWYVLVGRRIPAFQEEDYMPPADQLKYRVRFFYASGTTAAAQEDKFWKEEAETWQKEVEKFVGRSKTLTTAASAMVAPGDTAEQKARKLYAEVQKLENLSDAASAAAEDQNNGRARSAEQVLEQHRGYSSDLTRLYVALARAVGLHAFVMHVSSRDKWLFERVMLDESQLNREIAIVEVDGKETFVDPGTKYCPFGMLDWKHTAIQGIRETAAGKTEFSETPAPEYRTNRTERIGRLRLSPEGSLTGTITEQFYGEDALQHRQASLQTDERQRNQDLEEELGERLPEGSSVKLDGAKYWDDIANPLLVRFNVRIPNYASIAGKRLLVPVVLFRSDNTLSFTHADRKQPVYFAYPYYDIDDLVIQLPETLQVEDLPKSEKERRDFASYILNIDSEKHLLKFRRDLVMGGFVFPLLEYPSLRSFYEQVRNGDGEQAVLKFAASTQTESNLQAH